MSTSVDSLVQRPGFLLSRVGSAIQSAFKDVLARWQMRPLHFLVLVALNREDGVSQQALCEALAIDSGNMVELIDRLEALELARRSRDPHDRRRHLVTITAAGRKALAGIGAQVEEMEREFLGPLTAQERTGLATALGKLYANTPEGRREAAPVGTDARGAA